MRAKTHLARLDPGRRRSVLLVIFVLVWGALWSSHARSFQSEKDGSWIEVCTSQGPQLVQLDGDAASSEEHASKPTQACAYCRLHACLSLPPPEPQLGAHSLAVLPHAPLWLGEVSFNDGGWQPGLPRAPPQ